MKSTLLATLLGSVWVWAHLDSESSAIDPSRRDTVGSHPFAKFKLLRPDIEPDEAPAPSSDPAVAPPLECFQVSEPVLTPEAPSSPDSAVDESLSGEIACNALLMEHTFVNSYGAPFVGMSRATTSNRIERLKLTYH